MCDHQQPATVPPPSGKRRKLWDLQPWLHCALIGTCLTMAELAKAARQCGLYKTQTTPSDFELHRVLVGLAEHPGRESKILHNLLEKKFHRHIKSLRHADTADLETAWADALHNGEIPGMFWAILTHPRLPQALAARIYGEVHMLSHLVGASNRADFRRLHALQAQVRGLSETLAAKQERHHAQLAEREQRIQDLEHRLARYRARLIDDHEYLNLQRQLEATELQLERAERRAERAERRYAEQLMHNDASQHQVSALKELLAETQEELAAAEAGLLRISAANTPPPLPDKTAHPSVGLAGRTILYVGGRRHLEPHLRTLVERQQGAFRYHDGGLEDGVTTLQCSMQGADWVFCPVDCVSHEACLSVKKFCKQRDRPFIPLRNASLSAFARGLQQLEK